MNYYKPEWLQRVVRRVVRDEARSEAGDTLLEVLIAIVVLGMASVALLMSFATSISASSTYRNVATIDTVLRSASEEVITQIQQQPAALFESCGGAANVTFSLPSGYTAAITSVSYWDGSAFISTCVPNAEQWITLKVTETQNGQSATNNFIVDDPLARPIVTPGAAAQLVFIEQPGNASMNTALTPEPIVAIEDANGNIVTTDLSPVTLAITPGTGTSGANLSASCSGTEFYGVVTFSSCTIDTAGQGYTLTASDGSLSSATSNAFTVSTGVPTQLVFATQPGSSAGGSTLSTQPVIDVEDANGYLVTTDNSTINLAVTPSTGSPGAALSGCTEAESSGVVTFSGCAVSLAGNGYTLTAVDGSLTSATSTAFNITVGAAAKLVFTTQPTATASGNTLATQPVVKVEDAAGNLVTTATTAITLSSSGGSLTNCGGLTAVGGVVNVSGCVFAGLVNTNYTLSASATGLSTATSSNFTVTVGQPAKLVFTSVTAGVASTSPTSPFSTQPVVSVEDTAGNVVSNYTGSIALSISASESLSCSTGTTLVPTKGVATFSGCAGSAYGSNISLTASTSGLTSAVSPAFDISNVASQLVFTSQPVNTADGQLITPAVAVSVEDASGIVVTTSKAPISLAIGANPGSAVLSGSALATAVNGVATYPTLSLNALGTGYTLVASSGSFTPTFSTAFNVVVGAPAILVFTTQPVGGASGSALATEPVVKVEDSAGNVVTTATTTITLNASGGTLASCSGLSATSGVVNVSSCTFAGLVGTNYTLSASASGLTSATSSNFSPSTFGTAAKLVFTTQPVGGASGSALATEPVVKVEDSAGNVVANSSTTITLSASGGTLASCSGLSASSGVVSVKSCTFAGLVGTNYTLSASASGLTTATSSTFSPSTFGAASTLLFTTQPGSGASGSILTTQPVVEVEDSAGNVVTNSSTTITLSASGGTLASCSGLSATSGVVNVSSCTFAGLVGANYTLSASASGLTTATSSDFSPSSFGSAAKLVFTTQPVGGASGSALATEPVVKVEDSAGNVVTTATTTITLNASGGTLASCSGLSATSGVVNVSSCTFAGLVGTNYTLSASASGLTSATSSNFSPSTFGTAAKLVFTTQPVGGASGSALATEPVVKVEDSAGNVVANSSTTITLSASGGTLASCSGLSASSGVVSVKNCTETGLVNTNYSLTASASGLTAATSNTFTVTFGTATKLVFTTQPVGGASGSALATEPVVKVEDSAGNVVTNSSTTITLSASGGTLASCAGLSATSGVVNVSSCTFAGLVGTNYTLSASASGLTSATSSNFSPSTFGTAAKLVFTTQPVGGASGSALATEPVVKVEDSAGNVVANSSTTITLSASGGTLASCSGLSASSGVVSVKSCTFAGLVGTNYTLSASASGLTTATSSNFSPSTFGTATKLVFTTQPVGGASGSALATEPVVKVEDSAGNVVTTATTTITLNASGGTLASCSGLSATSGVVNVSSCTFAGLVGTNYTLSASASGLTSATSSNFSPSTFGTAAKLVFTTQLVGGASGSALATEPVVKVEDSAGNVVANSSTTITLSASGGTLASCSGLSASSGVVSVKSCTFAGLVGTNYTLSASASGLTTATSSNFSPSTFGAASKLVFTTSTTGVASSSATTGFSTQPVVTVEDSAGNVVTNYSSSVTLAISAGETLSCTSGTSKTPTSGVATFSGCAGTAYASGVTLTASSTGLTSTTSASFDISNVATQLVFTVEPANATHGGTISPAVVVSVEDASGIVVTTSSASIAVAIGTNPGSGTLSGTSPVTALNGVATFSNVSISAAGAGYTLKATSSGLTTATSSAFTES